MKYWELAATSSSATQNGLVKRGQANKEVSNRLAPSTSGATRMASMSGLP